MTYAALMLKDIWEQPAALRRLVDDDSAIAEVAVRIRERSPRQLKLVAHGSSDNAALYGVYALALLTGIPVVRESLSLRLYYGARDVRPDDVVLAVSQSGETPDVVAFVESVVEGALTVGITNDTSSSLARVSDMIIPIQARPERSIPATKTYLNQLATFFLLAAHISKSEASARSLLLQVADDVEDSIADTVAKADDIAARLVSVERMFVIGRGIEFSTARETALKLIESCGVVAAAMTTTDFCHGPIAAVDPSVVVWAVAADTATLPSARDATHRTVLAGGRLVTVGACAYMIPGAECSIQTPKGRDLLLSPLVSIIPGQCVAAALARAKGINPDAPSELFKKVTRVA